MLRHAFRAHQERRRDLPSERHQRHDRGIGPRTSSPRKRYTPWRRYASPEKYSRHSAPGRLFLTASATGTTSTRLRDREGASSWGSGTMGWRLVPENRTAPAFHRVKLLCPSSSPPPTPHPHLRASHRRQNRARDHRSKHSAMHNSAAFVIRLAISLISGRDGKEGVEARGDGTRRRPPSPRNRAEGKVRIFRDWESLETGRGGGMYFPSPGIFHPSEAEKVGVRTGKRQ